MSLPCRWAGWIPDFQHRHLPQFFSSGRHRRARCEHGATRRRGAASGAEQRDRRAAIFGQLFPSDAAKARVLTFATFPEEDWYAPFAAPELAGSAAALLRRVQSILGAQKPPHAFRRAALCCARAALRIPVLCTGQLDDHRDADYASTHPGNARAERAAETRCGCSAWCRAECRSS